MNILGISAFYHDSAACLVRDGDIVAAAQEERFTRKKHDHRFPQNAVDYCLKEAGITAAELDHVAFYDKPLLKFERLLETYLSYAPLGFRSFLKAMPLWLRQKLHLPREMDRGLLQQYRGRYIFAEHHESHAASAFYPSPFEEAAILTLDGVGEWATASQGIGRGNKLELTHEMRFPHSVGLLYSAFTTFTGFKVNSGEYKLMGLAPYGEPRFKDAILEKLIDLKPDGSLAMDMSYFAFCHGLTMTSPRMDQLFEGPPRAPEAPLTQREMDIAASIQAVTEEVMLRCAKELSRRTKMKNLVMAGGVALNCVAGGKILSEGVFDDIWIQPAAGDAGGALGAALLVWHQLLGKPRQVDGVHDRQHGSLLGPRYTNDEIQGFLDGVGARYRKFDEEPALLDHIADQIASEKVIGHLHGRMEFGPRALGSRSILGDARSTRMQSVMNLKIKFRESFRPFAPLVLRERVHEWFEMRPGQDSAYMLLVAGVHPDKRLPNTAESGEMKGVDRLLKVVRSQVPAVTHVDYSSRIQTVDPDRHGRVYRLLRRFESKTGVPVVINTSFNVRSEPIVCTPEHAYRCFMATNMDVLVLEDFVLRKEDQPKAKQHEIDSYLAQFDLD
ncbi:MAG: carbamoyltransferase [Candidatus Wallbacteria bacterium]|nr:carbamoyltransferase [Candidatus Wallbacteria bacterium]